MGRSCGILWIFLPISVPFPSFLRFHLQSFQTRSSRDWPKKGRVCARAWGRETAKDVAGAALLTPTQRRRQQNLHNHWRGESESGLVSGRVSARRRAGDAATCCTKPKAWPGNMLTRLRRRSADVDSGSNCDSRGGSAHSTFRSSSPKHLFDTRLTHTHTRVRTHTHLCQWLSRPAVVVVAKSANNSAPKKIASEPKANEAKRSAAPESDRSSSAFFGFGSVRERGSHSESNRSSRRTVLPSLWVTKKKLNWS